MYELALVLNGKTIDSTHDTLPEARRALNTFMDENDLHRQGDSSRGDLVGPDGVVTGSYEFWKA